MLQPKRVKRRKVHNPRTLRVASRGTKLNFGSWGLKVEEPAWLTSNQLEAARRVISRALARGGKTWIRVFPDRPRTSKSGEVGMGGGAGALSHFVAPVGAGRIIFEIDGVPAELAEKALKSAGHKLPVKTRIVSR